ncbi:cysteine hydrolase family protein [Aquabacter spiritensis]|uniref:Nicotinamidase-related amidase n=1 Tax=Aquabacter spiritensis TaxID=933073 RepID=A0A4R3LSK0_9HYPH|nr:cysteine hydrolase [Aquabacter spiritensis]TCT03502.1 nicotinamidase-related amidase [Aquabacter spiritensis]
MGTGLIHGAPGAAVHLCIDMQRLFSEAGPWPTPWMPRVLPVARRIAERHPARTLFTRFVPPHRPEDRPGMWRIYYERWRAATRAELDPALIGLMPELAALTPPAVTLDKPGYSAFTAPDLLPALTRLRATCLIVTGAETDMCVLASVMAAVDLGLRVIVVADGICSSSDQGHDFLVTLFRSRFGSQIEVAPCAEVLETWRPEAEGP